MMRLKINGVEEELAVTTVSELLESRGIPATIDPTVARGWMLAHRHGSGGHVSPSGSTSCCRALILQTIISFIVPTGDAGGLSSS